MNTSHKLNDEPTQGKNQKSWLSRDSLINLKGSLRARVAIGITLPIFLALLSLSLIHYWRERQVMVSQVQLAAEQLGETALGSLRHAMLANDRVMIAEVVADIGNMANINQVHIIDNNGNVKVASKGELIGGLQKTSDTGCVECHLYTPEERPRTILLPGHNEIMRISSPIMNETDCRNCHREAKTHLGMLLVDISLFNTEARLLEDLRIDLLITAFTTIIFTTGIYFLIHKFIVRRVEAFRTPLAAFAGGNFSARLPTPRGPFDELDRLALTFNHMADELVRQANEEKERSQIRKRTIIEERERIARELHDGLAQLLGYVNTKAHAVRLLLKKQQTEEADYHLHQLEEAASELFTETREAIQGLKMYGETDSGLSEILKEYSAQFTRLSDLPVQIDVPPEIEQLSLPIEVRLQLLRITQEALTNVRKHATATQAWVQIYQQNGNLDLEIRDDGTGFDLDQFSKNGKSHFGLSVMQERAEAIGAKFVVNTSQGAGTSVRVSFPLNGRE